MKGCVRLLVATVLASTCLHNVWASGSSVTPDLRYSIEIRKASQVLLIRLGENVTRRFKVALGRGGQGDKQRIGDNKTPVGVYRVAGFREESPFHFFIHLSYPNVKDAFQGLRNHVISQRDFDRIITSLKSGIVPPQNTALGGSIGIHGIGEMTPEKLRIHQNLNWTQGCIALTNNEVMELTRYVQLGTRVEINE